MSPITVRAVSGSAERKLFLNLPWKIYQNDPYWIPPLRGNQAELVNYRKHPFYLNAECQTFLAFENEKPVGRVSAIIDHAHNKTHNEKRGFFGFFESIDNQQVANGLLQAAHDWLKQRGMESFRGPVNPAMNYECALLVEGFDRTPYFMMTYNKPYYEKLILGYGFQKVQDLYAFWGHIDMIPALDPKMKFIIEQATERFKITLRPLDQKNFLRDIRYFLEIYNRALPGTWGFVPLSNPELEHMAAGMKYLIVPELTAFAEVDGKPIGCMLGMLDYNPRIKLIDGKLFPFGFLRLLWNRRKIKQMRLISTNVVPEYQRWGVGLLLLYRLLPAIRKFGIQEAEFSWVLESNLLSRQSLERAGTKRYKTYRIYDFGGV